MPRLSPSDPTSFSRPDLVVVTNILIALEAKFDVKKFIGYTELFLKKIDDTCEELLLDVKELNIFSIKDKTNGESLSFKVTPHTDADIGSKLSIALPKNQSKPHIVISYETSANASGLQWLAPEQTAGKKHPYVFSQFQAIAARSFVPCQDTPTVKATYEAEIKCPKELKVVMSAVNVGSQIDGESATYKFKQSIPIQSYLIALAIGALEGRKIGPRSTVYAEKEYIDASEYEFKETETQLKIAEDICGEYVWQIYDLLVLPPSFPFGGMENPCLTFVTPTLLAGDRSLTDVISHEIAHSWTGNLVTNANFEHFWLNEGFTVFIERKILGRQKGAQVEDFDAHCGLSTLTETINRMGTTNPLTSLVVDLTSVHPDEAFSVVPYEKGFLFLRYLQDLVGGPSVFEPFLREYFKDFKYKSVTTDDFATYFKKHFASNAAIAGIDWERWLHQPGMPPVIPKYDRTILEAVTKNAKMYLDWDVAESAAFPLSADAMSKQEIIQLLDEIIKVGKQPLEKLKRWEEAWKLSSIANAEIKFRWYRICIISQWEEMVEPVLAWINTVGRMKYTRPLYRDMFAWQAIRAKVVRNFEANRSAMMHVSSYTLAKDLHLS